MSPILKIEAEGFIIEAKTRKFLSSAPAECLAIMRPGYVVAWVEPHRDEDPELHFIGMRPFREDQEPFWRVAKLACEIAKLLAW